MAERRDTPGTVSLPPTDTQAVNRAMVEAERQAEERQADETVPGGKYRVGDQIVDAEGKPIGDRG